MSVTYHPQTNDQKKEVNKRGNIFSMFYLIRDCKMGLVDTLVEWWENTTYHGAPKMSPCEVVYGKKNPLLVLYLLGTSKVQRVDKTLNACTGFLHTLKEKLVLAHNRMKQQVD
jgi:hypothetical protein